MPKYVYDRFIKANTPPKDASKINFYNGSGSKVYSIPIIHSDKVKNYSFLALSDVHITYNTANEDFQRALAYMENTDCKFACICGDLTETGDVDELEQYKNVVVSYAKTKPVYAIGGNHETLREAMTFEKLIPYTGYPMFYSFGVDNQGNKLAEDVSKTPFVYSDDVKDVYIMMGYVGKEWSYQYFVTTEQLQWLYETLEANRNKRCFIFEHVYPWDDGVGDAERLYNQNYWHTGDNSIGQAFINLLLHYKNAILLHGHSHLRYQLQEVDKKANYSSVIGYRSVHISSLAVPRDRLNDGSGYTNIFAESEGYIVDVYDNYIILNGRDFIDNEADGHILPIATYKIDTTIQTVEANTFTDSTGIIKT